MFFHAQPGIKRGSATVRPPWGICGSPYRGAVTPENYREKEKRSFAFDSMVEKIKAIGAEIARIWEPVTERIKRLFAAIKSQVDALNWGEAFSKAGWALVDVYRAVVETIIAIAAPIVEALNIPAIVYESVNLYTAAMTALKDILDAIRPGLEAFVEKGIKPIAEWIGGKVAESLRKMQEWLGKIGAWFSEHEPMFTAFGDAIGELLGAIWSVLEPIFNIIGDTLWKKFGDDLGFIGGAMEIIVPLITLIADILTPLVEIVAGLLNILIGIVTLDFSQVEAGANQIVEAFTTGFNDVGESATALWESVKSVWEDVSSWFDTAVIQPVKTAFSTFTKAVGTFFSTAWSSIKGVWSSVSGWFDRTIITPVKTAFSNVTTSIKGFFTGLWSGIKSTFTSVANWFKTTVTEPIGNFFNGAVNVVIRALNSLIRGLNKVKINLPSWGILGDLAGKSFGINIATIPTLANGGLVNSGQLFMARENGITEMVGGFGNKSGAANNSQIVDGIRQGVADASSEQNALLREQNRLLRQLLDKEGKVVFPTSVEAGRAVQRSINMYNVARGTT